MQCVTQRQKAANWTMLAGSPELILKHMNQIKWTDCREGDNLNSWCGRDTRDLSWIFIIVVLTVLLIPVEKITAAAISDTEAAWGSVSKDVSTCGGGGIKLQTLQLVETLSTSWATADPANTTTSDIRKRIGLQICSVSEQKHKSYEHMNKQLLYNEKRTWNVSFYSDWMNSLIHCLRNKHCSSSAVSLSNSNWITESCRFDLITSCWTLESATFRTFQQF